MKIWQKFTIGLLIFIILSFYSFLIISNNLSPDRNLMVSTKVAFNELFGMNDRLIIDFHINSEKKIDFIVPYTHYNNIMFPVSSRYNSILGGKDYFNVIKKIIIIPNKFPNEKLKKWYRLDIEKKMNFKNKKKSKEINPYHLLKPIYK